MDSGGGACDGEARTWRATIELIVLCREKGWVLAPADGNHYVVTTTGTGASAAAGQDEEEREGERCCRAVTNAPR